VAELLSNLVSIFFVGRLQTSQGLDAANLHKWGRVFSDKSGCRMVKTMLCAVNERQKKQCFLAVVRKDLTLPASKQLIGWNTGAESTREVK